MTSPTAPQSCGSRGAISRIRNIGLALLISGAVAAADPSGGGGFQLTGIPTCGNARSVGKAFAIDGSIVPIGPGHSTGANFVLQGQALGVQVIPGELSLNVIRLGTGEVQLTWPTNGGSYVLEFTEALGTRANWLPVLPPPAANSIVLPLSQPLRFFRLRSK
ncbi:MAG: hypothetical protein IT581_09130 [Verrucomicrobiales bacterium]|nr:hypothetical protein [Verrucomicrobiales bacterium]